MKERFWILQWSNGKYYAKGVVDGYESVDETDSPTDAVRFYSLDHAKRFHDSRGHFYYVEMKAVEVVVTVEISSTKHDIKAVKTAVEY